MTDVVTSVNDCPGFITSRLNSTLMPNTFSICNSISRCCPVVHTNVLNSSGRFRSSRMTGASLIASGRVPNTTNTVIVFPELCDSCTTFLRPRKGMSDVDAARLLQEHLLNLFTTLASFATRGGINVVFLPLAQNPYLRPLLVLPGWQLPPWCKSAPL